MTECKAAVWESLQQAVKVNMARFRETAAANPKRVVTWALFGLVALAFGIMLAWYPFMGWRTYDMLPVGLTLELPSRPEAVSLAKEAPVAVAVFECRTEKAATVVAAFDNVAGERNALQRVVKRTMDYLSLRSDLENLKYQVTIRPLKGHPAHHVSGTFKRDGAECRVVGTFVALDGRVAQVLCLFSDLDGARTMERIMASVDLL